MTVKKINYMTPVGLLKAIQEINDLNIKERADGLTPTVLCVDFWEPIGDPHDTLAVYDILSFHTDITIKARILSSASLFNLAMVAPLPSGSVFISDSSVVFSLKPENISFATATEMKIALEANNTLFVRINAAITSAYEFTTEELEQAYKETTIYSSKELIARGLSALKHGVV